jgi:hypothetical protein
MGGKTHPVQRGGIKVTPSTMLLASFFFRVRFGAEKKKSKI